VAKGSNGGNNVRRVRIIGVLALFLGAGLAIAGTTRAADFHVEYVFMPLRDGNSDGPSGSLIRVGGKLYGTTFLGGLRNCRQGCGTVFSFDPATGAETMVYAFQGGADGATPVAGLTNVGGILFGVTSNGGSSVCKGGCGTVFSVDPATAAEAVVHVFTGDDGAVPDAGLMKLGGILYGTTLRGGCPTCGAGGTVFSLDPASGKEAVLHTFGGRGDGVFPRGRPIEAGGKLYGTTGALNSSNCQGDCGTVYSLDPATGAEAIVHLFQGVDGDDPNGTLLKVGGKLYGTTTQGGSCDGSGTGCGVVFSIDLATGVEAVVYSFQGPTNGDGEGPYGGLSDVGGVLYGTTEGGGRTDHGVVYSLNPVTGAEAVLHAFTGKDGYLPFGGLTLVRDQLFGTTGGGGSGKDKLTGVIFSFRP